MTEERLKQLESDWANDDGPASEDIPELIEEVRKIRVEMEAFKELCENSENQYLALTLEKEVWGNEFIAVHIVKQENEALRQKLDVHVNASIDFSEKAETYKRLLVESRKWLRLVPMDENWSNVCRDLECRIDSALEKK